MNFDKKYVFEKLYRKSMAENLFNAVKSVKKVTIFKIFLQTFQYFKQAIMFQNIDN